jgi:hypothetical protein
MKKAIIIIITTITLSSCEYYEDYVDYSNFSEEDVKKLAELMYMKGQLDMMDGDKRFKWDEDKGLIWTKSPWNNGELPISDPNELFPVE